jgi:histidinol-phosphatase
MRILTAKEVEDRLENKMESLLHEAIHAAKAAARSIMPLYLTGLKSWKKKDGSLATEADELAEKIIITMLGDHFPDYGFLGEELGSQGSKNVRWIIDPLDGTDLALRKIPMWAIMIALEVWQQIALGIIYNPISKNLYTAYRGGGAYRNNVRLHVSRVNKLEDSFILVSSFVKLNKNPFWPGFQTLMDKVSSWRGIGDCPGWMLVANGSADLGAHFGLGPEDIAAPKIIIEEAGGKVTNLAGGDTIYSGHALATNGRLHKEVIKLLHSSLTTK